MLDRLRRRLSAEYPSSLLSAYLAMGTSMVAQVVIVPIYLATLGTEGFGALNLVLALISYAAVGVGWVSGGLLRLLGEAFGTKDDADFARTVGAGKVVFVGYAIVVALVGVGVSLNLHRSNLPFAAVVGAGLFLIASYETAVERLALTAAGRQVGTNLLQFAQVFVYATSVVFVLWAGGGLPGVFACHLASVITTRLLVPLAWQGKRPATDATLFGSLRPLFRRLTGRMAAGYFVAGVLVASTLSDVLVVGWLGGAEAAARFVLVWKIAEVGVQILWRIPETLTTILVRLDAVGDREAIGRRYRRVRSLMLAMAIPGGVAYAALGPWITRLWLGLDQAPQERLGFALAGAGIVWIGLARLPSVLSFALARFRLWNRVALVEMIARVGLTVVLYPQFGYLSPLIALNAVHVCGIAVAYQWVGRRLTADRS